MPSLAATVPTEFKTVLTTPHQTSKPFFTEKLDAIKAMCKEGCMLGEQMDNLRTNDRGVYVIQYNFKLVARLSSWESREVAIKHAITVRRYLACTECNLVYCDTHCIVHRVIKLGYHIIRVL